MSTADNLLDLCFRADLGLLFGRWLRVPADDTEMQRGYEVILALAVRHGARYWLLDVRRRGSLPAAATRWVSDVFLPRLAGSLSPRPCLAYLLSPSHLADYASLPPATAPAACELALFSDEHTALDWLHQHRQLETALAS